MKIEGVFEVAVKVRDLERATGFYAQVLGFQKGYYDAQRRWQFLWMGDEAGVVVLQEEAGDWPRQHFAFAIDGRDLETIQRELEDQGLTVQGPVPLHYKQLRSLYFSDPDGHDLELCAVRN